MLVYSTGYKYKPTEFELVANSLFSVTLFTYSNTLNHHNSNEPSNTLYCIYFTMGLDNFPFAQVSKFELSRIIYRFDPKGFIEEGSL